MAYESARKLYLSGLEGEVSDTAREDVHREGLAAMDRAVRKTARPMDVEQKSLVESLANDISRQFLLFRSDPRKQFAMTYMALAKLTRGKIGLGEASWRVFNSWLMYGILSQLVMDFVTWIKGRDDDEDFFGSWEDYLVSGLCGASAGIYGFVELMEYAGKKYLG